MTNVMSRGRAPTPWKAGLARDRATDGPPIGTANGRRGVMPGYSSRPPLKKPPAPKSGRKCLGCDREKAVTARPGLCMSCIDQRDRDREAAAEGL